MLTLSANPFTIRLPSGKYKITAERGKQYFPQTKSVRKAIEDGTYRSRRQLLILMVESLIALGRYDQAAKEIDLALLRYPMSIRLLKLGHTANLYCGQTNRASEMLTKINRYGGPFKIEFWVLPRLDFLVTFGESDLGFLYPSHLLFSLHYESS